MSYPQLGNHYCTVTSSSSKYELPQLSPIATKWKKFCRYLHFFRFPTYRHPETKHVFKSEIALQMEVYRQWMSTSVIIHPFSMIHICKEYFMTHYWGLHLILISIYYGFYFGEDARFLPLDLTMRAIALTYQVTCFISGFRCGNEIILDVRPIVVRYLKTHFTLDFLEWFPINAVCLSTVGDLQTCKLISIINFLVLLRVSLFVEYATTVLNLYGIPSRLHRIIIIVILFLGMTHFFACLLHGLPSYTRNVAMNHIAYGVHGSSYWDMYVYSLYEVTSHCFFAVPDLSKQIRPEECILFIVLLAVSYSFRIFLMINILDCFDKLGASRNRYEEVLEQIKDYLERKKFTPHLTLKVLRYYKRKQMHRLFAGDFLESNLSEHLRYELILSSRNHLINTSTFLKSFSVNIVGQIISSITPELILPNEVISHSADVDCMYFINHGTVATYSAEGVEYTHYEDGALIGIVNFVTGKNSVSFIAVDYCEVFVWNFTDVVKMCLMHKDIDRVLNRVAAERLRLIETKPFQLETTIVELLQNGKILEKPTKRQYKPETVDSKFIFS